MMAAFSRGALPQALMTDLGIAPRPERILPLREAVVEGEPGVDRDVVHPKNIPIFVEGAAAFQVPPRSDVESDVRLRGTAEPVFLDKNGNGRQDPDESDDGVAVAASVDGPGARRVFVISDADMFDDARISKHPQHALLFSDTVAWLAAAAERRKLAPAGAPRFHAGDKCRGTPSVCDPARTHTLECRGGLLAEDLTCAGPRGCSERTADAVCDQPHVDFRRAFEDLPAALARAKDEARAIGVKIQLSISGAAGGDAGGQWYLDLSAPSFTPGTGPEPDCTVAVSSEYMTQLFVKDGMSLYFSGRMKITGKDNCWLNLERALQLRNR